MGATMKLKTSLLILFIRQKRWRRFVLLTQLHTYFKCSYFLKRKLAQEIVWDVSFGKAKRIVSPQIKLLNPFHILILKPILVLINIQRKHFRRFFDSIKNWIFYYILCSFVIWNTELSSLEKRLNRIFSEEWNLSSLEHHFKVSMSTKRV